MVSSKFNVSVYHPGEQAVQAMAGVVDKANRMAGAIAPEVPPVAREFLRSLQFVVIGGVDEEAHVWASVIYGEPGFAQFDDDVTPRLVVRGFPPAGDPLERALQVGAPVGAIAIDPQTRRRMRMNGRLVDAVGGQLRMDLDAVYSNCPKYIQARSISNVTKQAALPAVRAKSLSASQASAIQKADTFFVASFCTEGGADASHRGGNPGFVDVVSERGLMWPDYRGNSMFNTLGNIQLNPAAGLLFIEWETGSTLQLSGHAFIDWSRPSDEYRGAERLVRFAIDSVVETSNVLPFQWRFDSYSKANPPTRFTRS